MNVILAQTKSLLNEMNEKDMKCLSAYISLYQRVKLEVSETCSLEEADETAEGQYEIGVCGYSKHGKICWKTMV